MTKKLSAKCAKCPTVVCVPRITADETPTLDKAPAFCPMKVMPDVIENAVAEYDKPDVKEFARLASLQEFECYEHTPDGMRTKNPRILELFQFAQKCGYKKLGLAFCAGLANEASILTDMLENKGFEVVSVRCKVGATPKERIGIKAEEKIRGADSWESMCSPIVQAEILNSEKVDLAIMLGLCIGHDTLFIKYCRVPMTVLAVKDRVTGHNPLAALYLSSSYYARLMSKTK
ncbi:MAG: metal-binding protein [Chloroflexi bacterium CG_4_9_14_3_um_filter_45_9]|nr:MAG: metal-binding protein [Chloroflexi bacterium CG08_land_8_20_14_0_20_45_12]PJB48987.1 MAG: metal-binding protein [Chloroflexi bacterium CG_4_9_14_3_um_filter_45_9]